MTTPNFLMLVEPSYKHIFEDLSDYPDNTIIIDLHNQGIITGFPDRTFKPYQPIVKHQAAAMISRAFSLPTKGYYERLDDVDVAHPNYSAIHYLHMANIFSSPCRKFYPNSQMTYVEVTNLLSQIVNVLLGPAFVSTLQFPATLNSKSIVSRQQFATMLSKTIHLISQNTHNIIPKYKAV